ncbi:hypothetical protein B0T21DRAFT_346310 [Apiosordaria backusii]|uniref:Secreted protein n=1 Tax=Apiosordaria backusii TaxID=314023 RepID=A0AA40ENE8_9PEZI|nr:hypothetical protein B0T21DRAFT_346310 [Apiosordaria backusii]
MVLVCIGVKVPLFAQLLCESSLEQAGPQVARERVGHVSVLQARCRTANAPRPSARIGARVVCLGWDSVWTKLSRRATSDVEPQSPCNVEVSVCHDADGVGRAVVSNAWCELGALSRWELSVIDSRFPQTLEVFRMPVAATAASVNVNKYASTPLAACRMSSLNKRTLWLFGWARVVFVALAGRKLAWYQ